MKACHAQKNNYGEYFVQLFSLHDNYLIANINAELVLYFGFFVDLCTSFLIERNKHFSILIMRINYYFFFIELEWDFGVCKQVNMLKERDNKYGAITFVDIDADDYSPDENNGIEFETVFHI
jgi:hypothetical protein